jgi:uncharacterized membrane protein
MTRILEHLRDKLLAGVIAAIPVAIVVVVAWWLEEHTRPLAASLGLQFPGLGFVIAVVGLYLLGVVVTSFIGQLLLRWLNLWLERVPGLNLLYKAWKDLLVVSPDKAGMFHQPVMVPTAGPTAQLGFTNGKELPGDPDHICVFLPNIPNPFSGRLIVVPRNKCRPLKLSTEEAVKYQLSSGNYLPTELVGLAQNVE